MVNDWLVFGLVSVKGGKSEGGEGDEGAFAARRPTAGHVPVVWVRRPAEDVVIRLAPLCARVTTDRQYRGADGADRAQYIKGAP